MDTRSHIPLWRTLLDQQSGLQAGFHFQSDTTLHMPLWRILLDESLAGAREALKPLLEAVARTVAGDSTESMRWHELVETFEKSVRPVYQPDSDEEPSVFALDCFALSASCAFALAVWEKQKSAWPHSERFKELIANAERVCMFFRQPCCAQARQGLRGDMEYLLGLLWIESFGINAAESNFELALDRLGNGIAQLLEFWVLSPDFEVRQAIHCFEMLRARPESVEDWASVALTCFGLAHALADLGIEHPEETFEDAQGIAWSWREYWARAQGFAESRLSPDHWRDWKEREEREHAERHMEHLFFPRIWRQLPKLASDALVQAEVMWWSRDRSTKSAVVDNLWKATRQIVLERLWNPFAQYARSAPAKSLQSLKSESLLTDGSGEPGLGELISATWQDPRFPEFANMLGLPQEEYRFLFGIKKDLLRLNDLRNDSMHPDKGAPLEPHDIEWAYRTFLGVGCEGILPRLASIRATVPPAKGH